MIENPRDLIVIRLALEAVLRLPTADEYRRDAEEVLGKVKRLEQDWIIARARRRPAANNAGGGSDV